MVCPLFAGTITTKLQAIYGVLTAPVK
eukprot:SAG11_NODE_24139_length_377_cov_1.661871_1_plen_26_part_01